MVWGTPSIKVFLMAVPKRKTSKAKSRSRRASNWRLESAPRSLCDRCNTPKRPHAVCSNCGWYHGRQAIEVS
jgi:large subunit ribosomal protein L32